MSGQPEVWRTDPRERLLTAIDATWAYSELGATPEQLVDTFAHELAEVIRTGGCGCACAEVNADRIDPGTGPVRPDEETR